MMRDTKSFQLIFVGICVALTVVGVFIFSFGGAKPDPSRNNGPTVVIWGTDPERPFTDTINEVNALSESDSSVVNINARYEQKDPATFNQDLLEALASGKGPDVVLLDAEDVLSYQNKLVTIPFSAYPERTFKDTFIPLGELFTTAQGYIALPFSVDPLVMYWNRDIFTARDKPVPPSTWSQVLSLVPELRDVDVNLSVFKSAISLGDYRNITNAKSILAALMLQGGSPITKLDYDATEEKYKLSSRLNQKSAQEETLNSNSEVLSFYTQFADPLSKVYTWNRSLPSSQNMFTSDDLAIYLGFGSEAPLLKAKNPNLDFDMTLFPQQASNGAPVTYGRMKAFIILSASKNRSGSLATMRALTSRPFIESYTKKTGLPPVRRDLLATPPGDAYSAVLYRSALYARGYLDPDAEKTNDIFRDMIESILSGKSVASSALQEADSQFQLLVNEFNLKQ